MLTCGIMHNWSENIEDFNIYMSLGFAKIMQSLKRVIETAFMIIFLSA